jgi:N-acetylglucosaminyl-diphospho-decaprenol L-rhamnosyltransferase
MKIRCCIVSHGHSAYLTDGRLKEIRNCKSIELYVVDNLYEPLLEHYCHDHGIAYGVNENVKGFGSNNNSVFLDSAKLDSDYYLLINPDVRISTEILNNFSKRLSEDNPAIATLCMNDTNTKRRNEHIRRYPGLRAQLCSFLGFDLSHYYYSECERQRLSSVDWCCGGFMAIRTNVYHSISGFDEQFFMYMEDVDICRRVYDKTGEPVRYYHELEAEHNTAMASRKIFSKLFAHHLASVFKYYLKWGMK